VSSVIEQVKPFSVKRAALAATVGNMLEFYDFITYSFFAIQIGHTFFPTGSEYGSLMLSLATFGAGFVTRPIGGIVLGIYSDRIGRRPAMLLSFALMELSILTIALTPSYQSIGLAAPVVVIAARMAQGFASETASDQDLKTRPESGALVGW
jgi:MFS transporter, MHS family, citrate/tricarballylate:H+ symporter